MDGMVPRVQSDRPVVETRKAPRRPAQQEHERKDPEHASEPGSGAAEDTTGTPEHPAPRGPHEDGVGDRLDVTA